MKGRNGGELLITRLRFEVSGVNGWWVRLHKGSAQTDSYRSVASKVFNDNKYKDSASAKRAAIRWRNKKMREHECTGAWGGGVTKNHYYLSTVSSTSGMSGVSHKAARQYNNPCWSASWQESREDGTRKQRTRSFSYDPAVPKSEIIAHQKAVNQRKSMVKVHSVGVV
jgi:hypothetical protein